MMEPHKLIWISPVIPQHELEGVYHWMNTHLKEAGLLPMSSFTRIKTSFCFEPEEALRLEFEVRGLTDVEALAIFKENIWSEVFAGSQPCPAPFAVSLQSERTLSTQKKLICFDMDSTLINQEVIDEMARAFGFYEKVAEITEAAMQGKLDFKTSLRNRVALFRGMPLAQVKSILPTLSLSPGGDALLPYLRSAHIKTAVVSGGFEMILRHFQRELLLDQVYGNTLCTDDFGMLTGELEDPIVDAEYKQKLVAQLKLNYGANQDEAVVVGDGANDLLMMAEGSTQVSFCGKPKLAAHANSLILHRNLLWIKSLI